MILPFHICWSFMVFTCLYNYEYKYKFTNKTNKRIYLNKYIRAYGSHLPVAPVRTSCWLPVWCEWFNWWWWSASSKSWFISTTMQLFVATLFRVGHTLYTIHCYLRIHMIYIIIIIITIILSSISNIVLYLLAWSSS